MKILLVHNFYGSESPSGENMVFEAERNLLETRGHDVRVFVRHSDDIRKNGLRGMLHGAFVTPWNPRTVGLIRREVEDFGADVVHIHNTFPLISPSIFYGVGKRAAKVLTLHNYRLLCPSAIPMRGGNVCTNCIDRHSVLPSLIHGCYRGSRPATAPLAACVSLHRAIGTWRNKVDAFIALSDFQREILGRGGLPREKIFVKPNFYPGEPNQVTMRERSEKYVAYVGRLSEEKGLRTLVEAWKRWGASAPELRIIGDGPLREWIIANRGTSNIKMIGLLPLKEAQASISRASLVVLPSQWFECFPMVIREAFAFGTPVAVSDIGPLPSIVRDGECGIIFKPSDVGSLLEEVRKAMTDSSLLEKIGNGGRKEFEIMYNENANYEMLMHIYAHAINNNRNEDSSTSR